MGSNPNNFQIKRRVVYDFKGPTFCSFIFLAIHIRLIIAATNVWLLLLIV